MNLIGDIDRISDLIPDRIVLRSGNAVMTYGQLRRRSDILAHYFRRQLSGSDRRAPVIFYGHKETEMLVGFLGALKSGHPYIPVDRAVPKKRLEKIISGSNAPVVMRPHDIVVLTENSPWVPYESRQIRSEDPFYIMYTSGSTGEPKGVVITYGNVQSFLRWILHEQNFTFQREIFLDQVPCSFDVSIMSIYPCLLTGGTLWSIRSQDVGNPGQLFRSVEQSKITVWVSTPSFVRMCLTERTFSAVMLPDLRRFLFCGETLPRDTAATLLERFPKAAIWNLYGPTEATVATTSVQIRADMLTKYRSLPVGFAQPESRIVIMNGKDHILQADRRGEIVIIGKNISAGYLGRQKLTDEAFFSRNGLRAYRTGDRGYIHHGMLFFVGRNDTQIKLHGYRIELGDIEAHLLSLPNVRSAVVFARSKKGIPWSLSACVILTKRQTTDQEEMRMVREQLKKRLPAYMIPKKFYFLSDFPVTANGKVDRKKLSATHL